MPGTRSSLPRGAGIIAVVCGGLTAASHPAFTAPAPKGPAPKRPAPRTPRRTPVKPPALRPDGGMKTPAPVVRPLPGREAPVTLQPAGNEIIRVADVKPGMKGYGLTVFQGTKIEKFDVEVIAVMPKAITGETMVKDQSLVLVRMSGGPITERSAFLIQGMSGSPIYINGKLLGAFSMGYTWPKEPIGMVTPIEDMMEALDPKLSQVPVGQDVALGPLLPAPDFASGENDLFQGGGLFRSPVESPLAVAGGQTLRPLALPVTVSGLSGRRLERASQLLTNFNMAVTQGPGAMTKPFKASLEPGAALGVALMTGDVDMTSIGTVTYRKGDELLAFGHPMMQIGPAQFPICTAWIHDVFSGLQSSFKMGSGGELCGTLVQDRPFSVAARVGPLPGMIPVRYTVADKSSGRSRTFNVKTANHPLLVGQLIPIAVNQGLVSVRPVPGDAVANVKLTVETEGAGTISRENVFYDAMQIDVAAVRELQEVMSLLANNSFRRVPVKSVDMEVTIENKRPTATVERIFLSQEKFEPGEEVEVGVVLRPYRREPVTLKSKIRVPKTAGNGRAVLVVQGGATRLNLSGAGAPGGPPGMMGGTTPPPDASLSQVIKRFTERERNDQLVVRLLFPTSAVNVNGERLSQLPSTVVDVMRSSKTTGFRIERDEAKASQDTDYFVQGVQLLPITLEKESHLEKPGTGGSRSGSSSTGGGSLSPSGPGVTMLSAGEELEELEELEEPSELSVFRFTVDGKPRVVRLTPEEDEEDEDEEDAKNEKKPEAKRPARAEISKKPVQPRKKDEKPSASAKAGTADDESDGGKPSGPTVTTTDDKLIGRAVKMWSQSSQSDFERGTFSNTAVSTNGEVRLTPALKLAHESGEQFVWSVAGIGGAVYAGTGNSGQVLKVDKDGKTSVFFRTGELEIHALARDAQGNLYAGTSPNGKIFRITPDGKGTELLAMSSGESAADSGGRFVLCLTAAPDGTVYAGTGPEGVVYRIAPGATSAEEYCRVSDRSVMSLLLGRDGTVYAGTAEEGSIFRIQPGPDGRARARVLYDTDQAAITGLAMDKEGVLYAASAPSGNVYKVLPDGTPRVHASRAKGALYGLLIDGDNNLYSASANSLVQIQPDGTYTLLTDAKKAQFTCLAWDDGGRMVAGSSNVGSVYRLDPAPSGTFESTIHDAKLPARWGRLRYTGVLPETGGSLRVQTRSGNTPEPDDSWSAWQDPETRNGGTFVASPAARFLQYRVLLEAEKGTPSLRELAVAYLPRNQAPKLTVAAPAGGEVWKGTQTLKWSATDPDGDTLTYELFYSADNGRTWKPLGQGAVASASAETVAASSSRANRPMRSTAEGALKDLEKQLEKDSSLTAQEREQRLQNARKMVEQYFQENPEEAPAPAPSPAPAAPAPAKPAAAAGGKPANVTRGTSVSWNTKEIPDGIYVVRVVVTDRASNPSEPLADLKSTEPFIVANTPPQVFVFERGISVDDQGKAAVTGFTTGRVSLKGAQYRLGTGDWVAIEPEDGLWDSAFESFRFTAPVPGTAEQTLELKVVDQAGNVSVAKAKVKKQ